MIIDIFKIWIENKFGKKGMGLDYLGWLIIAVAVGVLAIVAIIMIKGEQEGGFQFIKDLLRWG